jgi:NADH:ubiquinone oxidoreductase subunit F (NADH-binding)
MDRALLEGVPHQVLEGLIIAAYAVGASHGFIYVRAEYPIAVDHVTQAIEQARAYGFLGESIFGTSFNFDLEVRMGAGAFVCGEETALIASLEGKRGMPRPRPPFPANRGFRGKPTNINNVETLANVPFIIREGSDSYRSVGTDGSPGTKIFALAGKVRETGLVEVPMGTTLREIVYDIGGGVPEGRVFKAAQIGGPSGGCVPEKYLDLAIDYDSVKEAGAIMGSGGLVIMDDRTCMVDVAKYFQGFTQEESCGKCVPCRVGTRHLVDTLTRICNGAGRPGDLGEMETLAQDVKAGSLCGLGQTAANPVLSTLTHFRDEYEAHIREHRCPAGVCEALITYRIDPDLCIGCGRCKKSCPVDVISGERKQPHVIDPSGCIKCGACRDVCPVDAVAVS